MTYNTRIYTMQLAYSVYIGIVHMVGRHQIKDFLEMIQRTLNIFVGDGQHMGVNLARLAALVAEQRVYYP